MQKTLQKQNLTLEAANSLIAHAIAKANELGVGGAIAVVDNGGHLICLHRIDGSMPAAANIAIGKAATAVGFNRPGTVLENTVTTDRMAMLILNSVTPFPFVPLMGSYPIEVNDQIVGAIAVAGAGNGENDEIITLYAIEKFSAI